MTKENKKFLRYLKRHKVFASLVILLLVWVAVNQWRCFGNIFCEMDENEIQITLNDRLREGENIDDLVVYLEKNYANCIPLQRLYEGDSPNYQYDCQFVIGSFMFVTSEYRVFLLSPGENNQKASAKVVKRTRGM